MRIFKLYKSRKIRDVKSKRYTTVKEVLTLFGQGVKVVVYSHKSREDVTRKVLLSAIYQKALRDEQLTDSILSIFSI